MTVEIPLLYTILTSPVMPECEGAVAYNGHGFALSLPWTVKPCMPETEAPAYGGVNSLQGRQGAQGVAADVPSTVSFILLRVGSSLWGQPGREPADGRERAAEVHNFGARPRRRLFSAGTASQGAKEVLPPSTRMPWALQGFQ